MDKGFVLLNILLEADRVKWITDSNALVEISEEQLQSLLRGEKIKI